MTLSKILGYVSYILSLGGEVTIDAAELVAGTPVVIPVEPQVASVDGQPVYLCAVLSTNKNALAGLTATVPTLPTLSTSEAQPSTQNPPAPVGQVSRPTPTG